jgi:hypothetical protein
MNFVPFDPNNLPANKRDFWNGWILESEKATEKLLFLVKNGGSIEYESRIWSKLKRWLLENVFSGKCAYCETHLTVTDYGAADHYRPKGRVIAKLGKRSLLRSKDGRCHPGYYWLAYDWRNLIPSCSRCNTGGKLDYFPIEGDRVFAHSDTSDIIALDSIERPLLLHPYCCGDDHPRKHLAFSRRGYIKAREESKKGNTSIAVYGLRRRALRKRRHKSQVNAWNRLEKLFDTSPAKRRAFLQRFRDAEEEHSSAVLDYILLKLDELEADRELLTVDP